MLIKPTLVRKKAMSSDNQQVKSYQLRITPDSARQLIEHNSFQNQRPIRQWHVDDFAGKMKEGLFNSSSVIHIGVYSGSEYILDGQHRLLAVIQSNSPIDVTFVKHYVNSETDLAELYSTFDNHMRRSVSDSLRAYGVCHTMSIRVSESQSLAYAIRYIIGNFNRRLVSGIAPARLVEAIKTVMPYAYKYFSVISEGPKEFRRSFFRQPILAAALLTFAANEEKATRFWTDVVKGELLEAGDPAYTLRPIIHSFSLRDGRQERAFRGQYSQYGNTPFFFKACLLAWNSFINERKITQIKVHDTPVEIPWVIEKLGTTEIPLNL